MKTSLKWIKALVPGIADVTPQEYTDAMTMSGTKVEFYEAMNKDLEKIVIGQIKEIAPHTDADKLVVTQVDIGSETIQIVTGATNMKEGDKVPVVLDGGRVAGGHDGTKTEGGIKIKAGKLRGVMSNGMMCSIEELGSSRDMFPDAPEDGLYILPEDAPVGEDAVSYLGLDDVVIEYEITSNRVDCYSVLGIAREAAATFGKEFCPPEVPETGREGDVNDYISVEIKDPSLCKRFTARVVKNVKIAPSPKWMQRRLMAHGIRPINNIVDITNYVMEEYGQPMHAYDLDTIEDHKIIVRTADAGEKFTTLDGQERELDETMLMICDGKKPVGIGGIMGGENSMITENVTTMLFEAACFDGTNIRLSAKKLGMRTEASGIFEKGLDPNNAIEAMNRACALIEELGAGEVVKGVVDVYPTKREAIELPFESERYNKILGTDLSSETMLSYFPILEIGYNEETNMLSIPTFRQDLLSYADIAEEVARFYGYDKIPTTLPKGEALKGGLNPKMKLERVARDVAEFNGFSQIMTYSFESPKVYDRLKLSEEAPERAAITISNPLGEDFSIMRTLPLNGLLTSLATNYTRRNKDVRLYEMAKIYLPKALPLSELPDERVQFTLGMYGDNVDFFVMKGVVNEFLSRVGLGTKGSRIEYQAKAEGAERPYLHPGRKAEILCNGKHIGYIGEVHPSVLAEYGIKNRTVCAVVDMPSVFDLSQEAGIKKYTGISNFPASTRDISMVVPKDIPVGQIESVFESNGGAFLESYELFDIYEGAQIVAGFKSVAYSLVFRAPDKSLSDEDVSGAMNRILKALKDLGIELRS
ncbi:MAG: phenylalanine--tRNA ligase subunit beta [Lachnospiraceae bacterium]|nr:phenylalanine--tRNA ligase subunit beta [Lachnospiraceae bacterium]